MMPKRAKKPGSALDEARTLLEQDVRQAAGEMLEELGPPTISSGFGTRGAS